MAPGTSNNRFNIADANSPSVSPLTSTLTDLIYDFEREQTEQTISEPNAKRRGSTSNHTNVTKTAVGLRQLAKKIGNYGLTQEKLQCLGRKLQETV